MNSKLSCDLFFLMFCFYVDQLITRGGGFYRADMYTSFLKELRLSVAFHDSSKDTTWTTYSKQRSSK